MPAQAALAFVPSAFQFYQGIRQQKLANNLKEDKYIPPALKEAETRKRFRAGVTKLPGQTRAEEKIASSTANTISTTRRNAKDSSTVLEKTQQADAAEKAAIGDINQRVEGFKLKNEQELDRVLGQKASYEKASRDSFTAAKSALKGASSQNFYNAATNAATAGIITGSGGKQGAAGVSDTATPNVAGQAPPEEAPYFLQDPTSLFYKSLLLKYGMNRENIRK